MKSVMIANILIMTVFMICVTILAITFSKVSLLRWFVLLPFLGYRYKETPIAHPTEKGGVQG
jgi:uncharacterized membrane protein